MRARRVSGGRGAAPAIPAMPTCLSAVKLDGGAAVWHCTSLGDTLRGFRRPLLEQGEARIGEFYIQPGFTPLLIRRRRGRSGPEREVIGRQRRAEAIASQEIFGHQHERQQLNW